MTETALAAALPGLRARYAEPWRVYHGQSHIDALLALWRQQRFADPDAVLLAVWYHDAVYHPAAAGNEAASARLLGDEMAGKLAAPTLTAAIAMVLATAEHRLPTDTAWAANGALLDGALFLDMDLSILGASATEYDRYEAAITAEYRPFYEEGRYCQGRRAVLARFLGRDRLFLSPAFAVLETPARANLGRAIARLDARIGQITG